MTVRTHVVTTLVFGSLVAAFVLLPRSVGLLEPAELAIYDRLLTSGERSSSPILLVLIREADIRAQGHWPISDRDLAAALEQLIAAGALTIGLDLYRDLPVAPGVDRLRRLLRDEARVIAVSKFGAPEQEGIPPPDVLLGSLRVGFNDLPVDEDGHVRRGLLFMDDGSGAVETSFALRLAIATLAAEGIAPTADPETPEWLHLGAARFIPLEANYGAYSQLDAAGYQIPLDIEAESFDKIGFTALVRGEVDPALIRGRTILVGSHAKSLPDDFDVPVGPPMAGIEIHAHLVDQLIRSARGDATPRLSLREHEEIAMVLVAAMLGALASTVLTRGAFSGFAIGVGTIGIGIVLLGTASVWAFESDRWIPVVAPSLAWVSSVGVVNIWGLSRARTQRAELMRLFSHSVSPRIAEEIWEHRSELFREGRLHPRRLIATSLFVDMKDYSSSAAALAPDVLTEWVSDFLRTMTDIIDGHDGFVDDFFGDAIKADFGLPLPRTTDEEIAHDARQAASAAIEMGEALEALNETYRKRELPEVRMRIGIATGPLIAGSVGGAHRTKYTTFGGMPLLAQRLESADLVPHDFEKVSCRILLSESTHALLDREFVMESVGVLELKGLPPTSAHRLIGRRRL